MSIAAAILLFAVGWIGQSIGQSHGPGRSTATARRRSRPLLVAATAWGLALFFTAKRRMALPSILLLLAFVGGVFATAGFAPGPGRRRRRSSTDNARSAASSRRSSARDRRGRRLAALEAVPRADHRRGRRRRRRGDRRRPAGRGARRDRREPENIILGFVLLLGIGVFLFAMRWDCSDPARVTRRSDVAFWLHLLAAPMIVHPVFTLLGLNDGTATIGEGLVVILLYVVLGLTALAIDRRALLVSALAYVLYALNELFQQFGAVELNVALTALVIGSALLLLSAFWHQARGAGRPAAAGRSARAPAADRPGGG